MMLVENQGRKPNMTVGIRVEVEHLRITAGGPNIAVILKDVLKSLKL